jgi:hypothetical protein
LPVSLTITFTLACGLGIAETKRSWRHERLEEAVAAGFGLPIGTATYRCMNRLGTDDTAAQDSVVISLISRRLAGHGPSWSVETPGAAPIKAASFPIRIGSIGGAEKIQWRADSGQASTAIISFSDVIGDYGPTTIEVSLQPGDGKRTQSAAALTCLPDLNAIGSVD